MTFTYYERPSWFGLIRVRHSDDPDFAQMRPTKRVRGRRRYYRALRREAESFRIHPSGWYDHMHWHVDWQGLGNLRWRERREHLQALVTTFRRLLTDVHDWPTPHQVWLQIDAFDSSQDAVYLHTPNPNSDNFPNHFDNVVWDAPVPDCLRDLLDDPSWQFGRLDQYWTHFIVRHRPSA